MLSLPQSWVWDFWVAQDGPDYHLFYLHAPKSLGQEHRRHRAARIGHAVSRDLREWTVVSDPFGPGPEGEFDGTATWTGSVVRGPDGLWRMFYTGSRFLAPEPAPRHVQSVGVAVSEDLWSWHKAPGPVLEADPRWYETMHTSAWPEEAWRDPWVFPDPDGDGWHMLLTARGADGPLHDRGVIAHAVSADLRTWQAAPPLSAPGTGFAHLEVPQVERVDGQWFLVFSCDAVMLTADRRARFANPGSWVLPVEDPRGPFDVAAAVPLTTDELYSARLVQGPDGRWLVLAFCNGTAGDPFPGVICDPIPFGAGVPLPLSAGHPPATPTDLDRLSRASGRSVPVSPVPPALTDPSNVGCAHEVKE